MESGPVLFVLFLIGIGILLIVSVRKTLKDQAWQRARLASARRTPPLHPPQRARGPLATHTLEQPSTWERLTPSSIRDAFEKFLPEDPWRSLTASRVSEAFEEFTRKP